MSHPIKNRVLLPKGFSDQLPPEADREAAAIGILNALFSGFGYKRIKPPLVEFEDSLFAAGPGASVAQETFRVLDPQSYKMMAVRSDITPQIARIAATRLSNFARPLRLTYANDVLRTTANHHRTARQFCKVGCEIIGAPSIEADHELCVLAVIALKKLGLKNITLDLCLPRLIDNLFSAAELTPTLKDAIDNRDAARVQSLLGYNSKAVLVITLIQCSGDLKKTMSLLEDIVMCENALDDIKNLRLLLGHISAAFDDLGYTDVHITVDPFETKGFEYHHGIAFSLFADGENGELARGGRYMITGDAGHDIAEQACGFTLYMDTVGKAMPAERFCAPTYKTVDCKTSWATLVDMTDNGDMIVRNI